MKNRYLNLSVLKNVDEHKKSNKNQKNGEMHSPRIEDAAEKISMPGTPERSLGKATHIFFGNPNVKNIWDMRGTLRQLETLYT